MAKISANPQVKTYGKKELTGYLIGLAGQNIIYNVISSGLMYYFQSVIFLPAMAYGTFVAVARIWDAVNDPMMGSIVDKTHTKWGKCKPYLLFVPAIICVVTCLCFINGRYSDALPLAKKVIIIGWAAFSYILWGMCYTAGDIPLWGVTSLMTEDQKDRSKILALARIVAMVGVIGMLVQFAAPALKGFFAQRGVTDDAAQLQYSIMVLAVIVTVFASLLFQVTGFSVKEKIQQSDERRTMKQNFKTMWNCKPFRQLLISGVLRSPIQLLTTVAITLVMYFFFDNDPGKALMGENGLNVMLIIQVVFIAIGIFGGMIAASVITPKLAAKFEKKALYNFYSVVGAIPFVAVFIVYSIFGAELKTSIVATIIMGVVFFAASWAQGGLNVLQSIMIADCVDYEEYHNGARPDGVFFAGQSFITKLSAGIATIIQSVAFAYVGFEKDNMEALNKMLAEGKKVFAVDCPEYAAAMFFLVAVPPAIGMVLSAVPTWKYALPNTEHKRILSELVSKRRSSDEIAEAE